MKTSSKIFMVLSGVLLIVLGIVCMCSPAETLVSLAWLLGIILMASGISTFIFWLDAHKFLPSAATVLLYAIVEFIAGCFVASNLFDVAGTFPIIFAVFVLMAGINVTIHSFDFKKVKFGGWWVMTLLGIIAAAFGILCLMRPMAGAKAISILLGLAIAIHGLVYIVIVCGVNRFERKVSDTIQNVKEAIADRLP